MLFIIFRFFYVHPRPYKRTGEKQDGRPILEQDRTGENGRATIFYCFLLKNIGKTGENSRKKLDGRQKIVVGGRAIPKYRPSFYTGGGVYNFMYNVYTVRNTVRTTCNQNFGVQ